MNRRGFFARIAAAYLGIRNAPKIEKLWSPWNMMQRGHKINVDLGIASGDVVKRSIYRHLPGSDEWYLLGEVPGNEQAFWTDNAPVQAFEVKTRIITDKEDTYAEPLDPFNLRSVLGEPQPQPQPSPDEQAAG